jgi:hypothetical protein
MQLLKLADYGTYLLGFLMIVLGVAMPLYLSALAVHPGAPSTSVTTTIPAGGQSQDCSVSVTTITANNETHRHFNVTCGVQINISDTVTLTFAPGPQSLASAISSAFTFLSIVSAIGVAVATIVFQSSGLRKMGAIVLIPSLLALWAFSIAITLAVFYALSGPLSGSAPSLDGVFWLLRLTFWGLGLSILALAGIIRTKVTLQSSA